jgi:hypothetical protein
MTHKEYVEQYNKHREKRANVIKSLQYLLLEEDVQKYSIEIRTKILDLSHKHNNELDIILYRLDSFSFLDTKPTLSSVRQKTIDLLEKQTKEFEELYEHIVKKL